MHHLFGITPIKSGVDQLAGQCISSNTSVPRSTPITDKHGFYSVLCRTTYRYCKLAVILKFGFYLEIKAMSLVNKIMPKQTMVILHI